MELTHQVAVITGAGGAIGGAIALDLAKRGAKVALVGRTLAKLQTVALQDASNNTRCYALDLTQDQEVLKLVGKIRGDFGRVDILVHAAAEIVLGNVGQAKPEELDRQYQTNLRAPIVLTQALLPCLKLSKGQVAFVNSTAALQARANVSQYAATKHGLKAFADSLREEVNTDGIRVLSLFLGRTASPMQAKIFAAENRPFRPELLLQPEDVASAVGQALSLARTAEVTEIHMRPLIKSY
jgi:NADP-dependent 3-hydroxy acid dehydrogenase YdfG